MKTNEAPEKIYLTKTLLGVLRDGWDALPSEVFPNIEYTRTDALVEKICEWIRNGGSSWYLSSEFGEDVINFVKLAEDLENYIKENGL